MVVQPVQCMWCCGVVVLVLVGCGCGCGYRLQWSAVERHSHSSVLLKASLLLLVLIARSLAPRTQSPPRFQDHKASFSSCSRCVTACSTQLDDPSLPECQEYSCKRLLLASQSVTQCDGPTSPRDRRETDRASQALNMRDMGL